MTKPVPILKDTITSFQAAEILRCSNNTVNRLCAAGKLPHWMTGSHRRFSRKVVEAFAKANGIPIPGESVVATALPELRRPATVMVAAVHDPGRVVQAVADAIPGAHALSGPILNVAHLAGTDPPDAVIIGCDEGLGAAVELAEILLATPNPPAVAVVLGDDCDPWDERLSAVRSRLKWLGMTPATWDGVLHELGLLPAVVNAKATGSAVEEPGGVLAPG